MSLIPLFLTLPCTLILYKCYSSIHESLENKVGWLFQEEWDKCLWSITTVGCMKGQNGASYSSWFIPCSTVNTHATALTGKAVYFLQIKKTWSAPLCLSVFHVFWATYYLQMIPRYKNRIKDVDVNLFGLILTLCTSVLW